MDPLRIESVSVGQLRSRENPKVVREIIPRAFGSNGAGILLVSGLYDGFQRDRLQLYSATRALAHLSKSQLRELEMPHLSYSVGWCRGREKFGGRLDENKGSFYANPCYDHPAANLPTTVLPSDLPLLHDNVWPTDAACSQMEPLFKKIGTYITQLGFDVARHCDNYIRERLGEEVSCVSIETLLRQSRAMKARLLYYFSPDRVDSIIEQAGKNMWCGYHNDHGLITGLLSGAYYTGDDNAASETVSDPDAGLHVLISGHTDSVKAQIPPDCIAFQVGESAQIISGGVLRATPHCVVMPSDVDGLSRVSFAHFMQPNPSTILPVPNVELDGSPNLLATEPIIPDLGERYRKGDSFGDFSARSFKAYYEAV